MNSEDTRLAIFFMCVMIFFTSLISGIVTYNISTYKIEQQNDKLEK